MSEPGLVECFILSHQHSRCNSANKSSLYLVPRRHKAARDAQSQGCFRPEFSMFESALTGTGSHMHQTGSESAKALSSALVTGGPWSNWCEGRPTLKSSVASFLASSLICVLLLVKAASMHALRHVMA